MEFEKIVSKRLNGMAVRILSCIEDALGVGDIEDSDDDATFTATTDMLRVIRSEILNAAGETSRSIASLKVQPGVGKLSLSRDVIAILNKSEVEVVESDDGEKMPVFVARGDFNVLHKIRNEISVGIVYDKKYICRGVDEVVHFLVPFLDSALVAGIKIAGGDYASWRSTVCRIYLCGLEDD